MKKIKIVFDSHYVLDFEGMYSGNENSIWLYLRKKNGNMIKIRQDQILFIEESEA